MKHSKPEEILAKTIAAAEGKASLSITQMLILGLLAGMFIAMAGIGSGMASYGLTFDAETAGLAKMISGLIFPAGIIMVVLTGAELFTGNNLMISAVFAGRIKVSAMIRNWLIVFIANFAGAVFIAWVVSVSGLLSTGGGLLGDAVIDAACAKTDLSFVEAFLRGILCNFLVCIGVFAAAGGDSTTGKIFALYFPIWLFVTAGFEHSIANMYFIPAGIFAGAPVTVWEFLLQNLLPVTLGNLTGGCVFTAGAYYLAYGHGLKSACKKS